MNNHHGGKLRVFSFKGRIPKIHKSSYIHPSAILIGNVFISDNCFIGPNAVLRADNGSITILENSSVQDNCVIHSSTGHNVILRPYSRVGHSAVLHGCEIHSWAVIGIGATIMDGASIGEQSLIGAKSFVRKNDVIPPKSLVVGVPGIVKRELTWKEMEESRLVTLEYVAFPKFYKETSEETEPIYFDNIGDNYDE